jgi:uncharacterized protein YgbK (DUF1537 family)
MTATPPPLLILADDLTGAGDTAARCYSAGLPATIALRPPHPPLAAGATAFTSDSRHLPPTAAAAAVRAAVLTVATEPVIWYKKIDSTLRGNLGAEIDALLDTLGRSMAIICPAFPAQRRVLCDGALIIGDAAYPDRHLPSLLADQSHRPVAAIPLDIVRSGALAEHIAAAAGLLVVDALTDDDLAAIVEAAAHARPDALLCGSAGMVRPLAERLARPLVEPARRAVATDGPFLFAIGSGSPQAHRQMAALASAMPEIVLLHQPPPVPGAPLDGPEARALAEQFADAVVARASELRPAMLLLSGGDTAQTVLGRLGVAMLEVRAELLPGVPLARGVDAAGRNWHIALKPGSQGDDDALLTIARRAVEIMRQW